MPSLTVAKTFIILLNIIPRVIASPININNPPTRHLIPRTAISPSSSPSDTSFHTDVLVHIAIVIGVLIVLLGFGAWFRHARKQRGKKMEQQRAKLSFREYAYKPPPYTGTMRRDVPLPPYQPLPATGHTALQGGLVEPASAHVAGHVVG
jgi:hypothetical protein